ncbi:MAG: hypothetical protein JWO84_185 [Parcubacteria group bacterium]|nr:hypothetical protein [Parcubacteria group bacterium]
MKVEASEKYCLEDLLTTLNTSQHIVNVDRAFCVLVSLNSYRLAGDRKQVIDLLEAALQRLGKQATPRMLQAFAKHTGRKPVYVEAGTSVEKASESIELPEPAPTRTTGAVKTPPIAEIVAKPKRMSQKKARRLDNGSTTAKPKKKARPPKTAASPAAESGSGLEALPFMKQAVSPSVAAE